jgi:hypothetical protein
MSWQKRCVSSRNVHLRSVCVCIFPAWREGAASQMLPEVDAAYVKIRERNTDPLLATDKKDFGAEAFLETCFMLRKVRGAYNQDACAPRPSVMSLTLCRLRCAGVSARCGGDGARVSRILHHLHRSAFRHAGVALLRAAGDAHSAACACVCALPCVRSNMTWAAALQRIGSACVR